MMMETLQCPSCGAPFDYDPRGASETMRCPFCENTVMLPRRPQAQAPPMFSVQTSYSGASERARRNSRSATVVASVLFALAVVGIIAAIMARSNRTSSTHSVGTANSRNYPTPTKPAGDGYAQPEMTFGSEGIGPGNFKDARSIAVDADGHIYVGEYSGGRLQVFDASGKFLNQWTVDAKMPLRGMASDRRGTVYVVQSGSIKRYEGATGKSLGTLASGGYDDVATTPDGGLVTFAWKSRDDIVRLDSSGHVTKEIRAAVSGQTDNSELSARVACDGLGNVYALGTFNNAVFKFSPEGRFLTQFGGDGDQPGQFHAPSSIAIDSKGHIYVADIKGVQVFDPNGRYIGLIKLRGPSFGLAFNDGNELFVVARTQVYKFAPFTP